MGDPFVSVVILAYNQDEYINQAIECALAQKVTFEYEIVIGEDCSTDNTREICYRHQRMFPDKIRVITSDKNVGLLDNYYRTVNAARGKYVAVCGGDDYWHNPKKLQMQVEFLENNPEYGMVHSEVDRLFQKTGVIIKNYYASQGYFYNNTSEETLERIVSLKYFITASTAIFRKTMFDKYYDSVVFKRNRFMMEDTPFWAEIAAHSMIYYIPESLTTYRVIDGSLSNRTDHIKRLSFWKSVSEMRLFMCDKYKLPENVRKAAESAWFDKTLHLAFYQRNAELAMEVKRKKEKFTWQEWLRYWGAKNVLVHYGCRAAIYVKNFVILIISGVSKFTH